MELQTKVVIPPYDFNLNHSDTILAVGSCFASNISDKLAAAKFHIAANPFGTLYNPLSIASAIGRMLDRRRFTEADLATDGDLWYSFDAHSLIASKDKKECLAMLNNALEIGAKTLAEASTIMISLGTAWIYRLRSTGEVVANCHKVPTKYFERSRLSADEVCRAMAGIFERLPDKRIILTVSPIRHLKDGLQENAISKSALILATRELRDCYDNLRYFPAFEIMVDELRDYRFYAQDMIHPSPLAIEYIWERFRDTAIAPSAIELIDKIAKITAAAAHRPFNVASASHMEFMLTSLARAERVQAEHPEIDLGKEIEYFKR